MAEMFDAGRNYIEKVAHKLYHKAQAVDYATLELRILADYVYKYMPRGPDRDEAKFWLYGQLYGAKNISSVHDEVIVEMDETALKKTAKTMLQKLLDEMNSFDEPIHIRPFFDVFPEALKYTWDNLHEGENMSYPRGGHPIPQVTQGADMPAGDPPSYLPIPPPPLPHQQRLLPPVLEVQALERSNRDFQRINAELYNKNERLEKENKELRMEDGEVSRDEEINKLKKRDSELVGINRRFEQEILSLREMVRTLDARNWGKMLHGGSETGRLSSKKEADHVAVELTRLHEANVDFSKRVVEFSKKNIELNTELEHLRKDYAVALRDRNELRAALQMTPTGLKNLLGAIENLLRFVAGLNFQYHSISEQREARLLVHCMQVALKGEAGAR